MTDCRKLAKRRKLDEDPDAEKCQNCNTPVHEEENCYFGANMENLPPEWTLTEAQKSHWNIQTSTKTNKTKNRTTRTFFFGGFKLETPRPENQHLQLNDANPQDDWQRQVDTINIQLRQLTTESDSKHQDPTGSDENEPPQGSYYELLRETSDNCFPDNTQTTLS